jgi:hypothetical protein
LSAAGAIAGLGLPARQRAAVAAPTVAQKAGV